MKERLHHLDALRASAMLLLIPYHGSRFIWKGQVNKKEDGQPLEEIIWYVHSWHMPLFFLVSGYLLAMALERSGAQRQASNRITRLGIPLAIGMVTIIPLTNLLLAWVDPGRPVGGRERSADIATLFNWRPLHLWFLNYLLAACLILIVFWVVLRRTEIKRAISRAFGVIVGSPLAVPVLAVCTGLLLSLTTYWQAPPASDSLLPSLPLLSYYVFFLGFGFAISYHPDLISRIERRPLIYLIASLICIPFAWDLFLEQEPLASEPMAHLAATIVLGLMTWSALFAIWGFFARFAATESPFWRYVSDASYWVYLIHIIFLGPGQQALTETDLGPEARYAIAVGGSIAIAFLTYQLFIRHTPIGTFLHGRRPTKRQRRREEDDRQGLPAAAAS